MTTSTLFHWIALSKTPQLSPSNALELVAHFGSIQNLFSASSHELSRLNLNPSSKKAILAPNKALIHNEISWSQEHRSHHIISINHVNYPTLLKNISNPPLILYAKGNISCLNNPKISIVGSRNPSPYGKDIAHQFSHDLSINNFTVISGLALGIDGAAHQGALSANNSTIAVLGSGVNNIYPRQHIDLSQKIQESGLILSEFSLNTPPKRQHFPQRNRIISGLSIGTLIIEGALKSGSLITARYALEQNRDIYAVPGSVYNPLSLGPHRLIQQGAKLVLNHEDIISSIPDYHQKKITSPIALTKKPSQMLDPDHKKLLECVDHHITSIEMIISRSQLELPQISSMLTYLEYLDLVASKPGGYLRNKV